MDGAGPSMASWANFPESQALISHSASSVQVLSATRLLMFFVARGVPWFNCINKLFFILFFIIKKKANKNIVSLFF
jgi:hypothetical protein